MRERDIKQAVDDQCEYAWQVLLVLVTWAVVFTIAISVVVFAVFIFAKGVSALNAEDFPPPSIIGGATQSVQATVYSTSNCLPCDRYVKAIKKEMPGDGWVIKDASDSDATSAHILLTKSDTKADKIEAYPTTIIRKDGKEVERWEGYTNPDTLAKRLNHHMKKPGSG